MKFLFSLAAFWLFKSLGWIVLTGTTSLFWTVVLVFLILLVIDLFTALIQFLVQLLALPLTVVSLGCSFVAISGVFKYFGLYIAALVTGRFSLPWIFGPQWLPALVIGVVFALIDLVNARASVHIHRSSD